MALPIAVSAGPRGLSVLVIHRARQAQAPGRGGRGYGRYGYGGWGWGWGIGLGYWGFGDPYWYGGFPFWYDTLAYGTYWNPYYTNANDYGGYDYGAPIQQSQNPNQGPAGQPVLFAQARAAFYAGNYQEALRRY